jgi:hypothetical protein
VITAFPSLGGGVTNSGLPLKEVGTVRQRVRREQLLEFAEDTAGEPLRNHERADSASRSAGFPLICSALATSISTHW